MRKFYIHKTKNKQNKNKEKPQTLNKMRNDHHRLLLIEHLNVCGFEKTNSVIPAI